ncbi:hypothetical protein VNO80_09277 [Phaseolus coccineus]|uniref:Uncharacterized protein n=1 Tax=Phaseolus coccineus TaxID=3886 RepID=A0AAN9NC93_PHACN
MGCVCGKNKGEREKDSAAKAPADAPTVEIQPSRTFESPKLFGHRMDMFSDENANSCRKIYQMGCACGKEAKRSAQAEREEESGTVQAEGGEESPHVDTFQIQFGNDSPKLFGKNPNYAVFSDENTNSCVIM